MKKCIPCGAQAADLAVSCGACGEGSWRAVGPTSDVIGPAPTVAQAECAPVPPEPPELDAAVDVPAGPPVLFNEPAPAAQPQRPAHQPHHSDRRRGR